MKQANRPSKLTCRYKNDHPYLLVGPLKEEIVSKDPAILVHYDVISNGQAKRLRGLAANNVGATSFSLA